MPSRDRDAAHAGRSGARAASDWDRLQRVLDAVLDTPAAQRPARLSAVCGGDAALHARAARLLAACEHAERTPGVLDRAAAELAAPLLAAAAETARELDASRLERVREALAGVYDVEREIGRGGMAVVYLARDVRHDRPVALKVLAGNVDAASVARFRREIRTTARLTHPHILAVHDSGEAAGHLYCVMPFVEGETLRTRLARTGALPVDEAVRLLREIAEALAYAHGHGIVHRDLKPENVLLSGGHAVVADFGIATALAAVHGDGTAAVMPNAAAADVGFISTFMGTPGYMAPEMTRGVADARADLYALGVVACEMLSGTQPLRDGAAQAAGLPQDRGAAPELKRADLPEPLRALLLRLLAADPDARPASADEVRRTLEQVTRDAEALPAVRRRPAPVALAGVLVLLLVAAGGVVLGRRAGQADVQNATVPLRRIAVLPFTFTGEGGAGHLGDGITHELTQALARLPGVRVAGRTSSDAYRGRDVSAEEVGRALRVDAVVVGSVQSAGTRVRVNAQLVHTRDGTIGWSRSFEHEAGDILVLQDELARAVTRELAPALDASTLAATPGGSRGTADAEAWDLYSKGRYYLLERGRDNVQRAIELLQAATDRDPQFARAHAELALAYGVYMTYMPRLADSLVVRVRASAQRALTLNPELPEGLLAYATALELDMQFAEAERRYRELIMRDPANVFAHHWLGMMFLALGRTDEAITTLRAAARLDPLAKSVATAEAGSLIAARRFDEARGAARRALALDSTFALGLLGVGMAQLFDGQPDSAVAAFERLLRVQEDVPGVWAALTLAHAARGDWPAAEQLRTRLNGVSGDPSAVAHAAVAELVLGNREPLLRLLTSRDGQRLWYRVTTGFGCNPLLDPLWTEPRFVDAMRELGVPVCPLAKPWPLPPRAAGPRPATGAP